MTTMTTSPCIVGFCRPPNALITFLKQFEFHMSCDSKRYSRWWISLLRQNKSCQVPARFLSWFTQRTHWKSLEEKLDRKTFPWNQIILLAQNSPNWRRLDVNPLPSTPSYVISFRGEYMHFASLSCKKHIWSLSWYWGESLGCFFSTFRIANFPVFDIFTWLVLIY